MTVYPIQITLPLNTRACVQSGWEHVSEQGRPRIQTTWDDPLIVAIALLFSGTMTCEEILELDWSR